MIRKHIIKEGADWWKIFANRITKEASNKAIENGCNNELVNNLLNNSNIFVEKNGDGYVLFNNNDIICKVPKTSSFDDMVVMSINGLTNWITTKLNKNNLIESINVDNNQESKNATIKVNFNAYYSEKSKKFDGGLYPILEYIKDNKLKNVIVRLDYDKKNTTSWDEVDLYCSELSIKKLSFSINDTYPKYTAYIECNRKYVRFLIKMLIQMASLGNGGHSYGILINDKQFNFDGDGADHISSINDIKIDKKVYSDINKQIDIYNKSLNNDKNMNENKKQIKLTESEFKHIVSESVKSVINEISKSGLKKKWINKIYKVITPLTSRIYIDEAWENAKYVLRVIDELLDEYGFNYDKYGNVTSKKAEMNSWCENGGYWKPMHEFPNYKEFKFSIYFSENDFEINGSLKCHSAGKLNDPFEKYDITVTMW